MCVIIFSITFCVRKRKGRVNLWMEDVVLHYQPGSEARLNSLLETTEKLLKPFPCRTPPVFTPWFSDSHFPIRPAKSAPVINSFDNRYFQSSPHRPGLESIVQRTQEHLSVDRLIQGQKDFLLETKENLPLGGLKNSRASPHDHKHYCAVKASPFRRSWSVFTHKGVLLQNSEPLSRDFCHMVSMFQLHLRQRVRWVISKHNCPGDIEQVSVDICPFMLACWLTVNNW